MLSVIGTVQNPGRAQSFGSYLKTDLIAVGQLSLVVSFYLDRYSVVCALEENTILNVSKLLIKQILVHHVHSSVVHN